RRRDASGMACGARRYGDLVLALALAQDRELRRQRSELVRRGGDEVNALLVSQPSDYPQQGHRGIRSQAQAPLQRRLVRRLALERAGIVVLLDAQVRRRIPFARVDAVQDAVQLGLAPLEHAVQAAAEFLGAYFRGVGRADGRDRVRTDDSRLQEGKLAVELRPLGRVELRRQPERV